MFTDHQETATYDSADHNYSDSALVRKYAHEKPFSGKVTCEFTTDFALLYQYARLRDAAVNPWGEASSSAAKNKLMDAVQVIIARRDLLCIGGASITISKIKTPKSLPMESDALQLSALFPQLDLAESNYGEISDVVVVMDKSGDVMQTLLAGLLKLSVAEKVEYLFYAGSQPQARAMQRAMNALDVNCDIRRDIALPEMEQDDGIKRVLCIMDVSKYANSLRTKKREMLMVSEVV